MEQVRARDEKLVERRDEHSRLYYSRDSRLTALVVAGGLIGGVAGGLALLAAGMLWGWW